MDYFYTTEEFVTRKEYHSRVQEEIFGEQSPMILRETNPEEFERKCILVAEKMIERFGRNAQAREETGE